MDGNAKLCDIAAELRRQATITNRSKYIAQWPEYIAGALLQDAIAAGGLSGARYTVLRSEIREWLRPKEETNPTLREIMGATITVSNDVLFGRFFRMVRDTIDERVDSLASCMNWLADAIAPVSSEAGKKRFVAPECPKCKSKTKVASTRKNIRRLKCTNTKCKHTFPRMK